jgi:hypothetical protein
MRNKKQNPNPRSRNADEEEDLPGTYLVVVIAAKDLPDAGRESQPEPLGEEIHAAACASPTDSGPRAPS